MVVAPRNLTAATESILIAGFVIVLVVVMACGRPNTQLHRGNRPNPGNTVDSTMLSVEDLRGLSGLRSLTRQAPSDLTAPPPPDANAPPGCRALGGNSLAFADEWVQFRSVTYVGSTDTLGGAGLIPTVATATVRQTVGVYPDQNAAHASFDRVVAALSECKAFHASGTESVVTQPNTSALTVTSAGGRWTETYRVKSSTLINVLVAELPQHPRIAESIQQAMVDRVK